MKDTRSRHCFRVACWRSFSTRSAPPSSPRSANKAEVSRTYKFLAGIFPPAISASFLQQALNQALGAGASKGADRIGGHGNDPGGIALDGPFQCRIGTDVEFFSDFRWNGDLAAFRNFGTHRLKFTRWIVKIQAIHSNCLYSVRLAFVQTFLLPPFSKWGLESRGRSRPSPAKKGKL